MESPILSAVAGIRGPAWIPVRHLSISISVSTASTLLLDALLYLQNSTEAALGLIGGTMGLFTGFSILSGLEIIYYLVKLFMSLSLNKVVRIRRQTTN